MHGLPGYTCHTVSPLFLLDLCTRSSLHTRGSLGHHRLTIVTSYRYSRFFTGDYSGEVVFCILIESGTLSEHDWYTLDSVTHFTFLLSCLFARRAKSAIIIFNLWSCKANFSSWLLSLSSTRDMMVVCGMCCNCWVCSSVILLGLKCELKLDQGHSFVRLKRSYTPYKKSLW